VSQIYKSLVSGPVPPAVPTSFPTDNGTAVPVANVLNVLTNDTVSNFDNGITDTGSGNTITIFNTNRQTGTVTTTDDTVTTIITFVMDATPGTYYVYGNIQAYDITTPSSAAYSFSGGYRSDGVSGTELGTEFHDTFQDFILNTSDITLTTSGNNILVQVQGVIGLTIHWNALLEYRRVS